MFSLSAEYSSNVRGLSGNLSDLPVSSSQYNILLYSETGNSICVTCWNCWFLDLVADFDLPGQDAWARGLTAYM